MSRSILITVATLICTTGTSCATGPTPCTADPFVGFHAAQSLAMLELKRSEKDGKYYGSLWVDGGPFPVELTRDGNLANGTARIGGAVRPLQAQSTPQGLVLVIDGESTKTALHCYPSPKAYEKQPGMTGNSYGTVIQITTQP